MPSPSLIRMRWDGFVELERALRALGQDRLIRATLKRALLRAGQPMATKAQARAPRGPEKGKPHMADRISVSATLSRRHRRGRSRMAASDAIVYVGAAPRGPAVLAEFGTVRRSTKSGANRGVMPATPFMRPAWEESKDQILRDFTRELWGQIQASAVRLARRQARRRARA